MLRLTCPKHPPGDAETSQSKTSGSVVTTQEIVHALLKNIHGFTLTDSCDQLNAQLYFNS